MPVLRKASVLSGYLLSGNSPCNKIELICAYYDAKFE